MTNQTPLGKDELKRLSQIVQQLLDSPDSLEFRNPVDHAGLGLEDYLNVVTTPMDLGTVNKKLQSLKYKTVEECLDELQLIWDNCKSYNAYGSWIWKLSDKLEKSFKKYVKNYLPLVNLPQAKRDVNNKPNDANPKNPQEVFNEVEAVSYNDKVEFSNNLKLLQPEQIGLIVHMIQNSSPTAFVEVDKERYQVVVDNIDPEVFGRCIKQMEVWVTGEQPIKRQKV